MKKIVIKKCKNLEKLIDCLDTRHDLERYANWSLGDGTLNDIRNFIDDCLNCGEINYDKTFQNLVEEDIKLYNYLLKNWKLGFFTFDSKLFESLAPKLEPYKQLAKIKISYKEKTITYQRCDVKDKNLKWEIADIITKEIYNFLINNFKTYSDVTDYYLFFTIQINQFCDEKRHISLLNVKDDIYQPFREYIINRLPDSKKIITNTLILKELKYRWKLINSWKKINLYNFIFFLISQTARLFPFNLCKENDKLINEIFSLEKLLFMGKNIKISYIKQLYYQLAKKSKLNLNVFEKLFWKGFYNFNFNFSGLKQFFDIIDKYNFKIFYFYKDKFLNKYKKINFNFLKSVWHLNEFKKVYIIIPNEFHVKEKIRYILKKKLY